jgi:hypothetical protein
MDLLGPANDDSFGSQRARSVPVLSSMSTVRGYPSKLKIFRIRGSRFWQVRCYIEGRMYVRSTRSEQKLNAVEFAKLFYDELLIRHRTAGDHDIKHGPQLGQNKRAGVPASLLFATVAERAIEAERGRMLRGELSLQSFKALRSRLQKQICSVLGKLDLRSITHQDLQQFIDGLVQRKASSVTIAQYMQAIRLVFRRALIEESIDRIPPFPKLRLSSHPRGGFTVAEYRLLLHTAKRLARIQDPPRALTHRDRAGGVYAKSSTVPSELAWVIGFMVNSFLRPSDLKYIQHKHVEIVRTNHVYLRLTIPETKRHRAQIVTLRPAVRIYQCLRDYHQRLGFAGAEDYLFLPQILDREAAAVVLSANFNKVLAAANLKIGELGQARSLYSLRHTSIMFRLLYGKGIDLLTLARNARTSVKMIEDFYASNLKAEMNIGLLQSRRGPAIRRGDNPFVFDGRI